MDHIVCYLIRSENVCFCLPIRSHVLQADTEEMFHVWINAFKEEIGALMQMMLSSRSSSGLSLNCDSPRASHENASDNSSSSK